MGDQQPPPRIQTLRTQTPDAVVSTYTLQQKQSIISSTAKIEEILKNKNNEIKTWKDNYNALLQQLGAIAPTVEKAVKDALQNLKLDTDLQAIKDAINKIDNEDVKNLINSKTDEILQKFSSVQVPVTIDAADADERLRRLIANEENLSSP
ncbi:4689_t:CDS:1 [Cetraspora pellucida]|uniref:4689_t:CDS:1 n=1 Tax=Cetraspora pellucida TaxID=1433469 RepID=A0ACA9R5H8_9GLOM|nr:4689_t:CDS:1 [Cetraspora pellucida]